MTKRPYFICAFLLATLSLAQTAEMQRFAVLQPHSEPSLAPVLLWDKGSYAAWTPSPSQIQVLESVLPQISQLKIKGYESRPLRIEHPEECFRQYVGVLHRSKRRIYVNALCIDPPPTNWRKRFYVAIDGDLGFWHAFYDPETKLFSDLTINPRA
jgi:hypothetical protein